MDFYANLAEEYMSKWGLTADDIALVSVKNRFHASLNPKAHYKELIDKNDVLRSRAVVGPLTTLMCAPVSDGAAAVVLSSEDFARQRCDHPLVHIAASSLATTQNKSGSRSVTTRTVELAYELAGIGFQDLSICELHDATAFSELMLYEELGFCASGAGVGFLRDGCSSLGGSLPINTSGGLLSRGHPIGATGCAQIVEVFDQLVGRCGSRQITDTRFGLCHNVGGHLGTEPAVCVTTILKTP